MKTAEAITNDQDVIDSRDIIERIKFLEDNEETLDEDEKKELTDLKAVEDEASGYSDWKYGVGLIRESILH